MKDPMQQLARWLIEAGKREAWQVVIVPDEPVVYRGRPRQGRAVMERDSGEVLTADDTQDLAEAVLGPERLARLGVEAGTLEARVRLVEGGYASITAAKAGGQVTLVVRPVCTVDLDPKRIRVPEAIVAAAGSSNGLLIVTGPPGSGKTTTAYAILDHLNATAPIHIVTVGYHLEYVLEPKQAVIQERQIGVDVPDMLAGIQSAVLQGADVVFVAEVRELEAFNACLRVAEMDCLVIVQLHAATPGGAIRRMLSLQPDELRPGVTQSLATSLRGVVAQCLLPTPQGRQVPAYGVLVPDAHVRKAILEGDPALDDLCDPRLDRDIQTLRVEGKILPEVAAAALRRLET